jgi:hypothetical protein
MKNDRIRLPCEKAMSREGLDANYSLFEAAFPGLRPLS